MTRHRVGWGWMLLARHPALRVRDVMDRYRIESRVQYAREDVDDGDEGSVDPLLQPRRPRQAQPAWDRRRNSEGLPHFAENR